MHGGAHRGARCPLRACPQVSMAVNAGVPVPGFGASLAYFDTYRRARLPANLVQVGLVGRGMWGAACMGGHGEREARSVLAKAEAERCVCCVCTRTQAQRDFFGSHTYQRTDKEGWFHTVSWVLGGGTWG